MATRSPSWIMDQPCTALPQRLMAWRSKKAISPNPPIEVGGQLRQTPGAVLPAALRPRCRFPYTSGLRYPAAGR